MAPTGWVPAWRRLGLKLKSEEAALDNGNAVSSKASPKKKRKLSPPPAGEVKAITNGASHSPPPPQKKANQRQRERDVPDTTSAGAGVTNGSRDQNIQRESRSEQPPSPRLTFLKSSSQTNRDYTPRKSVSFSAATKTDDGDSTKRLMQEAVAVRLARLSGLEKAAVEEAEREVDEASAKGAKKEKKRRKKKKSEGKEGEGGDMSGDREEMAAATAPDGKAKAKGNDRAHVLDYLKTFHESRSTWKFSKLRQIALLKGIYNFEVVPAAYDEALRSYIEGLQGDGIRDSIYANAKNVVETEGQGADTPARNAEDGEDDGKVRGSAAKVERAKLVQAALEESYSKHPKAEAPKVQRAMVNGQERTGAAEVEDRGGGANAAESGKGSRDGANGTVKKKKRKRVRKRRTEVESESSSDDASSSDSSESESN